MFSLTICQPDKPPAYEQSVDNLLYLCVPSPVWNKVGTDVLIKEERIGNNIAPSIFQYATSASNGIVVGGPEATLPVAGSQMPVKHPFMADDSSSTNVIYHNVGSLHRTPAWAVCLFFIQFVLYCCSSPPLLVFSVQVMASSTPHENISKACVLGAGAFGTALSQLMARQGVPTTAWTRSEDVSDVINK